MSKQKIKSKVYYYKRKWRRSPTTPLFHSLFSLLSITLNWDKRKISWRRCTSTSNPILSYLLLASFGKHFVYDLLFLVNFIRWSPSQRSETDLRNWSPICASIVVCVITTWSLIFRILSTKSQSQNHSPAPHDLQTFLLFLKESRNR